jgi:hypothetical protein
MNYATIEAFWIQNSTVNGNYFMNRNLREAKPIHATCIPGLPYQQFHQDAIAALPLQAHVQYCTEFGKHEIFWWCRRLFLREGSLLFPSWASVEVHEWLVQV